MPDYYAHSLNTHQKRQLLDDHLTNVAQLTRDFSSALNAPALGHYVGAVHDIGKYHQAFQDYLLLSEQGLIPRGGPDHKAAGAIIAMEDGLELLAFVVVGHHGGLPSRKDLVPWLRHHGTDPAVRIAIDEAKRRGIVPSGDIPIDEQGVLQTELFIRLLFSALVDADFLDTETHFSASPALQRSTPVSMHFLWTVFDTWWHDRFSTPQNESVLNILRQQVYQQCVDAARLPSGFFRLTVPTGGGKTLSGLAFALLHASIHGLTRTIYAIPYTSITEQTADVFRAIFPDPYIVLEHHSGVDATEVQHDHWQRPASENWDAPLIVTTTVQLFESLLSRKSRGCRKLHNIAGSVIVLDEVQMLPTHLLETILDVLQQLVQQYGVTVVLCTATPPALDQRSGFAGLKDIREIIPDTKPLYTALARVHYSWPRSGEQWTWQQVAERMSKSSQALVIVNTRADAMSIALLLEGKDTFYLSTSLCGAHRRVVLQEVRRRLLCGEPCRLVSTQLIEAGVDLDFPLVLRAMGPLDSIAQAAGRCNREGKLSSGEVIVFDPAEGSLPPGPYRTGTMLTRTLLQQSVIDLADPQTYQQYFTRYYGLVNRDEPRVQAARRMFDYPEVAARFRMLADDTFSVIVLYSSVVQGLVDALRHDPIRRRMLFRQLQPYIVTLRASEKKQAEQQGHIEEVVPGILIWAGDYDPMYGVALLQDGEN